MQTNVGKNKRGKTREQQDQLRDFQGQLDVVANKSTQLLSDHWTIHREWEVDMPRKVEEILAVDWGKLDKIVEE